MYFLLAAYALCAVLSYQGPAFAALLPLGRLSVTLGILLWVTLSWFVAAYTASGARLALGALNATWAILLIANVGAPFSLLYSDITPISQALPSGQTRLTWQTSLSPWWTVAQLAMLATLAYAGRASYRLFRSADGRAAVALACGLVVLAATTIGDSLISLELLQSAYLTPFGFLVFLLACNLYPALPDERPSPLRGQPEAGYSLTLNLQPQASRLSPGQPGLALEQTPPSTGFAPWLEHRSDAVPARGMAAAETREQPALGRSVGAPVPEPGNAPTEPTGATIEDSMISLISDNLIDIAVNAALLSKRFRKGEVEPSAVEELCNRIRSGAIATRRITTRLRHPRRAQGDSESRKSP
jgi:hypothetical protein